MVSGAKEAMDQYGFGVSSARFICGTMKIHKELEQKLSSFHKKEECLLLLTGTDLNLEIYDTLLNEEDSVIFDECLHSSSLEGLRLCKAKKLPYRHLEVESLEKMLQESQSSRTRLVVTDGVFSTDGKLAPLDKIAPITKKYNAVLLVDDTHGVGVLGGNGRGTAELFKVENEVDILTASCLGAFGGGGGAYVATTRQIAGLLRQRCKTYTYTNVPPPLIAGGVMKAVELVEKSKELHQKLQENRKYFKSELKRVGFNLLDDDPSMICAISVGDSNSCK